MYWHCVPGRKLQLVGGWGGGYLAVQSDKPYSFLFFLAQELRTPPVESKPIVKSAGTSPDSEQENQKKSFHRSVSEYGSEEELVEHEFVLHRAVSVSSRRRNNSGGVLGVLWFPPLPHPGLVFPPVLTPVFIFSPVTSFPRAHLLVEGMLRFMFLT